MRLKQRFEQKFDEEIRFFKGMMQGPKTVGAIAPTSSVTARKMASVVEPRSGLPVLELGPGTGVITKQILARGVPAEKIVSIEYSKDFYQRLTQDYPGVHFIHGDAFDIDNTLGALAGQTFDSVISAVPLLSFPMQARISLLEKLLDRLPAGRPVVQITYGPVSPIVANPDRYHIQHFDFIVRNIPPAQLWIYSRG
ncbi:phospholipid N-methyltransferase PmtA [Rhizobium sp. G187]|uniref:phospholipid N-methyltransferase PmtA n=1 Tax=unclassified Rhizobium TaxID=2613769 RepID=UPI0006B8A87E|nr:class I SAM-dependent methyltransferase [Rhizobium sp. AAP43]KPF47380.1 SAM-dependent methyltransferase [Rhizobium sp. AAP43]